MKNDPNTITILHFNDVYTIDEGKDEPVGGVARFKTALEQYKDLEPLTIFSGDAFSPSTLSNVTKGAHMIKPLNDFKIDVACMGNHEFDLYIDVLKDNISKCNFPWLLTNVIDPETKESFGGGKFYHTLQKNKLKLGFIGLAEYDWLTLLPFNPDEMIYEDFVECAKRMTKFLREEEKCDLVIALTHMRNHNDERLAKEFTDLDLILGGHDHVRVKECVNGTYFIKSGCEFREFSKITLTVLDEQQQQQHA
jgi:5'-nucleotidase